MGVLPGAEPFAADGGEVGVVLSHGFTGSPQSLRPWAEHLAAAGLDRPAPPAARARHRLVSAVEALRRQPGFRPTHISAPAAG